jgi:hypothetical protein
MRSLPAGRVKSRPVVSAAGRGAYAICALPDLCLGIVSRRLETQVPLGFLLCYETRSPGTSGAFFYWSSCHRPNVELAVIEQREFELPADGADIGLRKE